MRKHMEQNVTKPRILLSKENLREASRGIGGWLMTSTHDIAEICWFTVIIL